MGKKRKYWFVGTGDIEVSRNFKERVNAALLRYIEDEEIRLRSCGSGKVLTVKLNMGEQNQFLKDKGARFRLGRLKLYFNYDHGDMVEEFAL